MQGIIVMLVILRNLLILVGWRNLAPPRIAHAGLCVLCTYGAVDQDEFVIPMPRRYASCTGLCVLCTYGAADMINGSFFKSLALFFFAPMPSP
jgi:hypothetical protein